MAALLISPSSPVPGPTARSGSNVAMRDTSARSDVSQAEENPFQDILATEMASSTGPRPRPATAAAKVAASARLQPDENPVAANGTGIASLVPIVGNALNSTDEETATGINNLAGRSSVSSESVAANGTANASLVPFTGNPLHTIDEATALVPLIGNPLNTTEEATAITINDIAGRSSVSNKSVATELNAQAQLQTAAQGADTAIFPVASAIPAAAPLTQGSVVVESADAVAGSVLPGDAIPRSRINTGDGSGNATRYLARVPGNASSGGAVGFTGNRTVAAGAGLAARRERQEGLLRMASGEAQSPLVEAAADFAASGNFAVAAAAEMRHPTASAAGLSDATQPAPPGGATLQAEAIIATPTARTAPAASGALEPRVAAHGWDQALGEKLVWMAGKNHQVAQLHLNPPELGPLKITLTIDHDQASAQFVSAHLQVREAIETAMPRLREMLADSGITLGNTSVNDSAYGGQTQSETQHAPRGYKERAEIALADSDFEQRGAKALRSTRGLVDTFA